MATKTPIDPRDSLHGEEEVKPRFGPGSDDPSQSILDRPTFRDDDPGEEALAQREAAGGVSSPGAVGSEESGIADRLGKGFTGGAVGAALPGGNPMVQGLRRMLSFLRRNKRKSAVGGAVGGIVGFLIFVSGVAQGPFEFIHLAQLLEQFHFSSNENFGDDRGAKTLLYAITGRGAQRARLGIAGNYAADKWEAKLLEDTGLKPVYSSTTRYIAGFEIVNKDKFINKVLDIPDGSKTSRALEESMGKGAEITNAGNIAGQDIVTGTGEKLADNTLMVSVKDVGIGQRAKFIRTIGKLTGTNKVVSTLASRLLIKRAGADFHPLKRVYRKANEKLADWRANRREKSAEEDRTGSKSGKVGAKDTQDTNNDGKPDSASQADTQAADSAGEAISEAAAAPGKSTIKSILTKAGYGGVAVGILCAAKGFGDSVPDYKYANNVLPMIRMGMKAITIGNQIMSNEDISADELGAFQESLYDPATKKSWEDARTIQGEQGQKLTGPGMPAEAKLNNINDKPYFFDVLDAIPFLGTACDISNIGEHIPLVKDVLNIGSDVVLAGLNTAASAFGTSVDKIMEGALALVSGQSVDTLAQGADYGNLVNTGAFLAANDNAVSMGGSPLTNAQTAELRMYDRQNLNDENQTKSFAERYLDPYDANSLAGKLIDDTGASTKNVSSFFSSSLNLFTNSFASLLPFGSNPVSAAGNVDYGVPKFGFSLADQQNPKFEDPYDNAKKVEPHLKDLNDKYGKPCFGMTVTTTDNGIKLDTEAMGSDDLNVFKVLDKKECTQNSGALSSDTNSHKSFWSKLAFWRSDTAEAASGGGKVDPMFTRYRFYLADSMAVATQACFLADGDSQGEQYCNQLGFRSSSTGTGTAPTETAGATIDMAHLFDSSVSVACDSNTKDLGIQDGYTDGKKVKIRICAVPNLPSSGEESNGGYGVKGADGGAVVNSRVSGAVYAMVDAAKKDGVNLTAGSSFRTMAHQQALCPCDGVSVAHPGYSNHQMGLAIDFSIDSQSGQFWDWLSKNAADFGYKNYPAEAWHWSPTGH